MPTTQPNQGVLSVASRQHGSAPTALQTERRSASRTAVPRELDGTATRSIWKLRTRVAGRISNITKQ